MKKISRIQQTRHQLLHEPNKQFSVFTQKKLSQPSCIQRFKGFIKGDCKSPMRNTNDPTTLSILLQDFDKHLSKRGYSDTESQALSEQIKLRS